MSEHAVLTNDNVAEVLAEHRLDWDRIKRRITALSKRHPEGKLPAEHVGPYLTISRQAGCDGEAIAQQVGEDLGWTVLNGEIVDLMADLFQLDPNMLHLLDEAKANWVRDVVNDLLPLEVIDRDTYVHHLGRVFHLAALHDRVVLVGRGANLFLPRAGGLAVRLVRNEEQRIARIAERDGIELLRARKRATDLDHRRAQFVKHYFGRDVEDSLLYDLVINTTNLSQDNVVAIVARACRARGLES